MFKYATQSEASIGILFKCATASTTHAQSEIQATDDNCNCSCGQSVATLFKPGLNDGHIPEVYSNMPHNCNLSEARKGKFKFGTASATPPQSEVRSGHR